MKDRIKNALTRNWQIKLLSIMLAVVLWFFARVWLGR
jgi:hypothetical protein